MVLNFLDQSDTIYREMGTALDGKDLGKISHLAMFLKGNSQALGVWKAGRTCETMEHNGRLRDEDEEIDLTEAQALERISILYERLKVEIDEAKRWFEMNHPEMFK